MNRSPGQLMVNDSKKSWRRALSGLAGLAASLFLAFSLPSPAQMPAGGGLALSADWSMKGHDERRTGRSPVAGPRRGSRVWTYAADDGFVINMEPTATAGGVFFGTWGLMRSAGPRKSDWDKSDGKFIGLSLAEGRPLWAPLHPGKTPYAYKYAGRPLTRADRPAGPGMHWNWYNGTIEGTAAYDARDGTLFAGRGDGCVYAINSRTGALVWKFLTSNPARPDDPEGGGEVVGGPLLTPDRKIVVATFAAPATEKPPHQMRVETNAVYCLTREGRLLWRYPERDGLANPFVAPPALSIEGNRVYVATSLIDPAADCELTALDLTSGRAVWRLPLRGCGIQDFAVGRGNIIYAAGMQRQGMQIVPAAMAVADTGPAGRLIWGPAFALEPGKRPHLAGGVAIVETGAAVESVLVSTTNVRSLWDNNPSGKIYALDPASGGVLAEWSPERADPPGEGGLTDVSIDRDGTVYVGCRGRTRRAGKPMVNGRMYALARRGSTFAVLWSQAVDGNIDWASPAIGPDGGLYFGSSSKLPPAANMFVRPAKLNLPDADPLFYGIHD